VSLLGRGIVAPVPSQQLTVTGVNRILANEAAEAARSSSSTPRAAPSSSPSPVPAPRRLKVRRSPPPASPAATPAPQATSTVLNSSGGSVVAQCESAGAYLVSWSPQQGYEAVNVIRGPAATAQARFSNGQRIVIMKVACSGGVPTATTTVRRPSGDGGGGDE
jgi:hypothetical protein